MENQDLLKNLSEWLRGYIWLISLLPLAMLGLRYILRKKESFAKLLSGFSFTILIIFLVIDLLSPDQYTALFAFYSFSLGLIDILIDKNKEAFSSTVFYQQYSQIENHWKSILQGGQNIEKKRVFLEKSLDAVASSVEGEVITSNGISIQKSAIEEFTKQAGSVKTDYFWMCCSEEEFYKRIMATLYSKLFLQFDSTVLQGFQMTSSGSRMHGSVPEFVSTALTQELVANSDIIIFQYNTCVTSMADYAKDNCSGKLPPQPQIKLRRLIITNELDNYPKTQAFNQSDLNEICRWHETNKVALKFISKQDADGIFSSNCYYGQKDFSVIGMKNNSLVLLEADKMSSPQLLGGHFHDMYQLALKTDDSASRAKIIFDTLWDSGNAFGYSNNGNNYTLF